MSEKQEAIERLQALELRSGGSHEMLSSIAKAIYEPTYGGWTIGACQVLRDTLIKLLSETDAAAQGECALELPDLLRKAATGDYVGSRGRVTLNVAQLIGCESRTDITIIEALADKVEQAMREAYTKGCEDGIGVANKADMRAEYLRGRNDGYDEGYDAGFASADDWLAEHEDAMAEHGWVRLPKDADGEYIHIGDMLMDGLSQSFTPKKVKMLMLEDNEWMLNFGDGWCAMKHHEWHHYHAPTVEDVLRDMHAKLDEVTALYVGEAIDSDERDGDEARIFAEYASKLQLRGDAE